MNYDYGFLLINFNNIVLFIIYILFNKIITFHLQENYSVICKHNNENEVLMKLMV